jgi:hypothetical protein
LHFHSFKPTDSDILQIIQTKQPTSVRRPHAQIPTLLHGSSIRETSKLNLKQTYGSPHRYVLLYVSEGCQPSNRFYLIDTHDLTERTPEGRIDWKAYDVNTGETSMAERHCAITFCVLMAWTVSLIMCSEIAPPIHKWKPHLDSVLWVRCLNCAAKGKMT